MASFSTRATAMLLALLTSISNLLCGWFGYAKLTVDCDETVGAMLPVHSICRMPEYTTDSEIDRWFTRANVPTCRTHDIACTDMYRIFPDFSRDVDDPTAYDFAECDGVLASIAAMGMEPFFRLGISYSDPKRQGYLLMPPTDYQKWAEICEHIILHYNDGWADGYHYGITYWEIWNEPDNDEDLNENHFWLGTPEEFFRLYDLSAKYLKQKFPDIKVGGYGSCGFYALTKTNALNTGSSPRNQYFVTFFEDFLRYAEAHDTPMDFFSWHSYTSTEKNQRYIRYVRQMLSQAGYADTEIICNEWNYNPTKNTDIDRRYGANQTSMLIMFQNEKLDMAHFYCAAADYGQHSGLFVRDKKPSSAYYGFYAFGQLYAMKNQVKISGSMPKDLYAVAASDGENAGLLLANISEKRSRRLSVQCDGYMVTQCMTVNENGEWVEVALPDRIPAGSMLYITLRADAQTAKG